MKRTQELQRILGLMGSADEARQRFGDLVATFRVANALQQKDLAEKLKISRQHMCDIEAGRRMPSFEVRERLLAVMEERA